MLRSTVYETSYLWFQILARQQATGSLNMNQSSNQTQYMQPDFQGPPTDFKTKDSNFRRTGSACASFERVCRGSVAHKLRRAKSGGTAHSKAVVPVAQDFTPQKESKDNRSVSTTVTKLQTNKRHRKGKIDENLMVVGDRFAPHSIMSPLLRTQTQFTLSQRMTMNSPDLYAGFERLPHLEQVRMSLRHMDMHSEGSFPSRIHTPYSITTNRVNTPYSRSFSRSTNRATTPYAPSRSNTSLVEEYKPYIKYSPEIKAQYSQQLKYYWQLEQIFAKSLRILLLAYILFWICVECGLKKKVFWCVKALYLDIKAYMFCFYKCGTF